MSDNNQPGASPATPGPASQGELPGFGSFGANRGSGLARGKRPATPAAASSTPAAPSGYKPSALEVITPKSEYVNPFTGETTVPSAPPANEPAPQAAPAAPATPAPTPVAAEPAAPAPAAAAAPAPAAPAPQSAAASAETKPLFPYDGPEKEKAEIKILPPEAIKRPAVSWEAPGATPAAANPAEPRRDDRPTFRPERGERREPRAGGEGRPAREPRDGRPLEPREPRRDDRKFEPRTNQPYREERAPAAEAPKKSGGFFGWLKGLFGGKSASTPSTPSPSGGSRDGEPRRDGERDHGGHRRHRGGRGRGGPGGGGGYRDDNRGPRPEGQGHGGEGRSHGHGGEGQGDGEQGGFRRRRRRGGRGRFRGDGDRGPRPEGQQGGGAI